MIALLLTIALEFGIPGEFLVAIALQENRNLDPYAIHHNKDGSIDRGLMQLNSSWYNEEEWYVASENIRAAACHIVWLRSFDLDWWQVAAAYNCGVSKVQKDMIPSVSIVYANKVMQGVLDGWE